MEILNSMLYLLLCNSKVTTHAMGVLSSYWEYVFLALTIIEALGSGANSFPSLRQWVNDIYIFFAFHVLAMIPLFL